MTAGGATWARPRHMAVVNRNDKCHVLAAKLLYH